MQKTLSEIKDIAELIPGATVVYKYKDRFERVYYSKTLPELLGYTYQEYEKLNQKDPFALVFPSDLAEMKKALTEGIMSRRKISLSYRLIHKNGRQVWVRTYANYIGELEGSPLYFLSIFDISAEWDNQQSILEVSLRAYKRQLDAVMEMSQDALATCRMNLSKNTCYNGKSKYKNLDKLFNDGTVDGYWNVALELILPEEVEKVGFELSCRGFLNAFHEGKTKLSADCHYMIDEENERYVRTTINMAENPITKDVEAILYVEDITQRELDGQILKKLMEQHYEGIAVIDPKHKKTTIYQYAYNEDPSLLFHPLDTDSSMELFADLHVVEEEKASYKTKACLAAVEQALKEHQSYTFLFRFQDSKNEVRIKTATYYRLYEDNLILCLTEDITEITKKERENVEALKAEKLKVEQAIEAKTSFFSNISHDMRTPLNGILGFTQLAMEADTLTKCHECVRKIQSSGEFLLGLINDTLDISKIENGSVKLCLEAFSLNQAIREVITSIEEIAAGKGVKVVSVLPENDGKYILADKLRLQQMFTNLLGNAVKFTPKGGTVTFTAERRESKEYGSNHVITVKDTGIGMKKEFIPHAFEAFSQQGSIETQHEMGTGLGLAIVKQLIDLMNGHIDLQTEEGKGTEYTIYLPLKIVSEKGASQNETEAPAIELNGKQILLCEDHPINRDLAKRLLENKGLIVTLAEDGCSGVEIFQKSAEGFFDAILMDIRMPRMDGLEATRAIRMMERTDAKNIPIIAMTANAFDSDRQESIDAGMNVHLSKPLMPQKLYEVLAEEITRFEKESKS